MARRRGCFGCGCWAMIVVLLLLVGVVAAFYYRVPQRLGLRKAQAQQVFSGTPDREAAAAILEELRKGGLNLQGIALYVLPLEGEEGSVGIAVLDSSRGFDFMRVGERDLVVDRLKKLVTGKTLEEHDVERLAADYRGQDGKSVVILTAPTEDIKRYAEGKISDEELVHAVKGRVDVAALSKEVLKWRYLAGGESAWSFWPWCFSRALAAAPRLTRRNYGTLSGNGSWKTCGR